MPIEGILARLQASGGTLFSQGERPLSLRFASGGDLPADLLLPHVFHGREGLSQCYRYELECLSADANLELKSLLGQAAEVSLRLDDGARRFTGLVTEAQALEADGGFARYRLVIEPALAVLAHRFNSRVFQDKSVADIIAAILDEHRAANPGFAAVFVHEAHLLRRCEPRSYCIQYRESDLAFIERLAAEEGLSYRFVHGGGELSIRPENEGLGCEEGLDADVHPLHTFILTCASYPYPQGHTSQLRFHRASGPDGAGVVDRWHGERRLQSGRVSLVSFDYKAASLLAGSATSWLSRVGAATELAAHLEDYDPQALYYAQDDAALTHYARLRQEAKDLAGKTFFGEGNARGLEVGTWFELDDHPVHCLDTPEDRQFLVTELWFEARNALLPADADEDLPPYRNRFSAVRRHLPVLPAYRHSRHQKPTAPGATTAIVVGPAGEEIHTDEYGRIKLQFHWQRPRDHPDGSAAFDDRASTWVRVALPAAGAQWGHQFIPRVGQEVVVSFLESDIDRPVVTGVVHNGSHRPPAFSGVARLPAEKALSGMQSREYRGSGYNELLFDDSTGQLRTRLSSEHAKTQLNQGYLTHPRSDGKATPRGEGFELRTDAAGAVRAARGILLTAEEQGRAAGLQLDRSMLLGQLQAAEGSAQTLSDLAAQHGADPTETAQQSQLLRHLQHWEKGSNTAERDNPAEGGKPVIALSGPLGIVAGTPESVTVAAGHTLDLVSLKHTNLSVGGKLLARATAAFSLFVQGIRHKVAVKLIAALGDVEIKALDGQLLLYAKGKVSIISDEEIELQAPKVTTLAQGARADFGGGSITTQCQGCHTQKAAQHSVDGPGGAAVGQGFNPAAAAFDQRAALTWMGTGEPIANRRYRLTLEDGRILEGITDSEGRTEQFQSEIGFARYRIELPPDQDQT